MAPPAEQLQALAQRPRRWVGSVSFLAMQRPPWDGRIFDAALLNTGRASHDKTYFSVAGKLKEPSRSRNSSAGSSTARGFCGRRRGGRDSSGMPRCPCCGQPREGDTRSTRAPTKDELTSSLLRDWTDPSDVRSARQHLGPGGSDAPQPKSLAPAFDAAATPPGTQPAAAQPPPPEPAEPKGKGKGGKGKAPPPPRPAAKSAAVRSPVAKRARPFARWLDWRSMSADRVANTVFEGLMDAGPDLVDISNLERHFGHRQKSSAATTSGWQCTKEVEILSQRRAQNMLIAFRRQPLSSELLKALEDFEFSWLSTETMEVLLTAMPTPEEEKQLLSFDGDISELRDLEQELLPFASLVPSALQRLQLALLQRDLRERADLAQRRLAAVAQLAQRISSSGALRQTLRHVLLLGNALNGGDMVQGYSIEVLPRLALSKATSDQRITLLHLLVVQMMSADPSLPQQLIEDLAPITIVAALPLSQLAQELRGFSQDVAVAKAVLRRAFPAFDSPQQFFIGDEPDREDLEQCEQSEAQTNRRLARDLLREVYSRISQAPPKPLKHMAEAATENAEQLQVDLAETRDQVAIMLAFFAFSAVDATQLDAKSEEFFQLLKRFLAEFEQCVRDLPNLEELRDAAQFSAGDL